MTFRGAMKIAYSRFVKYRYTAIQINDDEKQKKKYDEDV